MKAAILLIGTELLNGAMIDTNSIYIAEELNKCGIEIEYKMVARDVVSEIINAIKYLKKNVDLIITTGGLGPTDDDITKEAVAKFLKKKLIIDEKDKKELLKKIKDRNINYSSLKEVEKPVGAITFKNDVGMAPATYIDGIASFPGFPNELKNMLPKFLKYYIKENDLKSKIYIKDIICYGIGESTLETEVKDIFTEDGIFYEFLVKDYGTLIRLQTKIENKKKVEKIVQKLYNRIAVFIIGEDEDRIENTLYQYLSKNNLKISTAESCTGGMIASKFIDVDGISEVFTEGIVSYSNEAKIKRLKVKKETLKKFGAVSEETAREMLAGLTTDVGIVTTGVAGPNGGTKEKPVGLVYIGIKVNDKVEIIKKIFNGERNKIRHRATMWAMYSLLKIFK